MGGMSGAIETAGCATPLSSRWDLALYLSNEPSAEALGYFVSSLRDLGHGENLDGTPRIFAPGWQPGATLGLAAQATGAGPARSCRMACQAVRPAAFQAAGFRAATLVAGAEGVGR